MAPYPQTLQVSVFVHSISYHEQLRLLKSKLAYLENITIVRLELFEILLHLQNLLKKYMTGEGTVLA